MPKKKSKFLIANIFYRTTKLKSIKEESEVDLQEFRDIQKRRYDEAIAAKKKEIEESDKNSGANDDTKVMAALASDYDANKEAVIEMLIGNVMNVNIDIPRVVKGDFEDDK